MPPETPERAGLAAPGATGRSTDAAVGRGPDAASSAGAAAGRRRIGIYGGSFDPVHNAHLALARLALAALALDELCWLPVGEPWQKSRRLAPAADREAMVRLAIADEPRFWLSRCELQRDGPSYTVDTVRQLQADRAMPADWFLVMGGDQYAGFHTWNRWQELLGQVTIAVAARPGVATAPAPQVLAAPHATLELPSMTVSSTAIRERLTAGRSIADLVPAAVAGYIERHHLYRHPRPGSDPVRS